MPQSQVYFVISNARPGTEQELNKLKDSPVSQMKMKRPYEVTEKRSGWRSKIRGGSETVRREFCYLTATQVSIN